MSADNPKVARGPWRRPSEQETGPDRSFGGYYRTSDRKVSGKDFRGVPLQTAEDAAVAAVRMGYNVIDAQIERGLDMARRLRGAATSAGVRTADDVLDQAENLLSRTAVLGLEWLETAANEPGSPLTRLLAAQYRMLGSFLGLVKPPEPPRPAETAQAPPAAPATASEQDPASPAAAAASASHRQVRIQHGGGSTLRAITIVSFDVGGPPAADDTPVDATFHCTSTTTLETLTGQLRHEAGGRWILEVWTTNQQPSGRWRAAICNAQREQVGIVDIDM
jgi:hypothetical protein